jgi:CheY-like chemotaxis protein
MIDKKAMLFVDDEKIILQSLKNQIKKHFGNRYLYEFAESGDEALEVIEELTEDNVELLLVVSDWLMPNMRGDEFLIQVHRRFPTVVKVMLTGHASEDAVGRAYQHANLHRCLRKPWEEQELIETLMSGLEAL